MKRRRKANAQPRVGRGAVALYHSTMTLRAAVVACWIALLWPAGSVAEQTSAGEPVEQLSCSAVFDSSDVSQAFVERMVSLAFAGKDDARLSKWTNGLRVLVRSEYQPQEFVVDAILDFRAQLPHVGEFNAITQLDWTSHAHFKDGDLFVYLVWYPTRAAREAGKQQYHALLREFSGSLSAEAIRPIIGSEDRWPFVGVVRSENGDIQRAIVVVDLEYARLGKQPAIFQFLTTAINPNPGNAFYLGLPGSTPDEKRIYKKAWHSKVAYDLAWTQEFQIYLELLLGRNVTPGMTRTQLADAVQSTLSQPRWKRRLAYLYACPSSGN